MRTLILLTLLTALFAVESVVEVKDPSGLLIERKETKTIDGEVILHGYRELWYPSGTKKRESVFAEGALNGQMLEWYPSGYLMRISYFSRGKSDGPSLTISTDGNCRIREIYSDGVPLKKEYVIGNTAIFNIEYQNGLPFSGVELTADFEDLGGRVKKITYEDGRKSGEDEVSETKIIDLLGVGDEMPNPASRTKVTSISLELSDITLEELGDMFSANKETKFSMKLSPEQRGATFSLTARDEPIVSVFQRIGVILNIKLTIIPGGFLFSNL